MHHFVSFKLCQVHCLLPGQLLVMQTEHMTCVLTSAAKDEKVWLLCIA